MYTCLFKKTCAYAPAYLHVCMANVHALMSNTHSHASNLLCALLKHTLKQTVECRNYMAPSFVFFRQCALHLRHIQRKYLCLKHSESSGNNSFLGFLMKKDFFLFIFGLCIYKGEQTNAWLRSWHKKKREFGVCVCVIFCVRAFNTFLLLFSCSLHTVVFGPGRWLSKKQKNGGAGTNRRRVCEYDVCACLFAGKKS